MTAMMIDDGKRVATGGARFQWHMIPIADIDLIARNTRGEENGSRSLQTLDVEWSDWNEDMAEKPQGSGEDGIARFQSLRR